MIARSTVRGLLAATVQFVPVGVGMGLKFSLLDRVAGPALPYLFETYVRSLWLDLLVTASIIGVSWYLGGGRSDVRAGLVFLVCPLASFVLCVILAIGLPKAGIAATFWTVVLPAILASVSLTLTSSAVAAWRSP